MPNRVIKESIKRSADIDSLTWFDECLFYRLIVTVDDYGCFDARPVLLKSELFPLKENVTKKSVEESLQRLVSVGLVRLYTVDDKPYLYLPTWEKHQRQRNKQRKFPAPPEWSFKKESAQDDGQPSNACQSFDGQLTVNCQSNDGQETADCQPESESESEIYSCPEPGVPDEKIARKTRKKPEPLPHDHKAYKAARWLSRKISERMPERKEDDEEDLQRWARDIEKIHRLDGYAWELISDVLVYSQEDRFWQTNILSGNALRRSFEKLMAREMQKYHE